MFENRLIALLLVSYFFELPGKEVAQDLLQVLVISDWYEII